MSGGERLELLRSRLRLHAALGIDTYPENDSLRRFFALTGSGSGLLSERRKDGRDIGKRTISGDRALDAPEQLVLLGQEVEGCTCCRLAQEKRGSVMGRGNPKCSLMVVGDFSLQENDDFSPAILFGKEEDIMLGKMMTAIDLGQEDIYVSNCLKCCPGGGNLPDSVSGKSCFSFLEREIALVRPGIICAMGEVAAGILTGSTEPLARLRGKFIKYRYQAGPEILVMPTYHPRFLLRHQEMKKATWLDLQAIKKKLAGIN
jgi:uracil-DNA glycosylase family 4